MLILGTMYDEKGNRVWKKKNMDQSLGGGVLQTERVKESRSRQRIV
jgi:hypothetical protein